MKNRFLIPAVVVMIGGATLFGAAYVNAQTPTPHQSIIEQIAQRFGLKAADVQSVFDKNKADRIGQMEKRYEDWLSQQVKDGKITDAQKQLLIAKHKDLQATMKNKAATFKNLTPDQRKAAVQQEKQDLDAWAKQNGIDIKYLFGGRLGMMGGKGMHGRWLKK